MNDVCMTYDEVVIGLVEKGVPRELAEQTARRAGQYLQGAPIPACDVKGVAVTRASRMNKTEARRAVYLEELRIAGRIARWDFQPEKLRLADNTFLTPDFRVVHLDGSVEMEDVKGRKGDGYWCEDDAKIKLKVAAELHPYRFSIVWERRDMSWTREEL